MCGKAPRSCVQRAVPKHPHPRLSFHPRREVSDRLRLMGGVKKLASSHPWVFVCFNVLKNKPLHIKIALSDCHNSMKSKQSLKTVKVDGN